MAASSSQYIKRPGLCIDRDAESDKPQPVYLLLLLRLGCLSCLLDWFEIAFICATEGTAPILWQVFERCAGVNAIAWIAFSRVVDVVTDYATILGHDLLLENLVVGQSGQNIQTILVQE